MNHKNQPKVTHPHKQLQLTLSNICLTYNFSLQTLHNTIAIVMNQNIVKICNKNVEVSLAALFISQKLHQIYPISIYQLCNQDIKIQRVLQMQKQILKQLKYKIANPLFIDICMQVAYKWDQFIHQLTCINVLFFIKNQNSCNNNDSNMKWQNKTISTHLQHIQNNQPFYYKTFAYNILTETCQKLAYQYKAKSYDSLCLALAVVSLCIKQTERHNNRLANHKEGKFKIKKNIQKSTQFIIADFMKQVYDIDYKEGLEEEIKFVKKINFGLKDISSQINNIATSKSKQNHSKIKIKRDSSTKNILLSSQNKKINKFN